MLDAFFVKRKSGCEIAPFDTGGKRCHSGDTVSATETKFSSVIRSRLIENKVAGRKPDSIRGLARAMARDDETAASTFKRSLFKWMSADGPSPSPASRAIVALALGVAASELGGDDDDEEPHPMVTELYRSLRRLVRDEIASMASENA